jgi:hypothetical protein
MSAVRVSLVEADAANWPVPDDATVPHLFNPFSGDTFHAFLAAAIASQRRHPRPLYTHGHLHRSVLDAGFTAVRARPRYALYERRPQ